jgi:hypothetical protein
LNLESPEEVKSDKNKTPRPKLSLDLSKIENVQKSGEEKAIDRFSPQQNITPVHKSAQKMFMIAVTPRAYN